MTRSEPWVQPFTRPSWDDWALGIAHAVATRGDCTRSQVGALLMDVVTH